MISNSNNVTNTILHSNIQSWSVYEERKIIFIKLNIEKWASYNIIFCKGMLVNVLLELVPRCNGTMKFHSFLICMEPIETGDCAGTHP